MLWEREGMCYHVSDVMATRDEAQMYCDAFDADLVSVETELENHYLKFLIQQKCGEQHKESLSWFTQTQPKPL